MPLNQVATVSVPESRMLSIQVWDRGSRSLSRRRSGRQSRPQPAIEGQVIRLRMPDLTQDRRKELVKVADQYAEKARIAVRNVRRDGMDHLKTKGKSTNQRGRTSRQIR